MLPETLIEKLACTRFNNWIMCDVEPELLLKIVPDIHESGRCRLTTCLAYDARAFDNTFHVVYVLDCRARGYICLRVRALPPGYRLPSLASVMDEPPCTWCEWEASELYGIVFEGHPGKGRLILPDTWPPDYHPMRKDAPPPPEPRVEPERVQAPVKGRGVPLGPYHPALHEPEFFELIVDGERVVGVNYRGFFVYRGIEKLAEDRFSFDQVPFLAERICGICGFTHSTAYCQALENALGVDPPARAKYLRTLLLEIERIHSHILWAAIMFHTVGFDTGFMHLMLVREDVMDAAEVLTGNRKTYAANIPGGVRVNPSNETIRAVVERVSRAARKAVKLARSYLEVSEIRSRFENVGVLTRKDAARLGALGPVARASGLDVDVRRDHPYAAYPELEFDVPVRDEGDVLARFLVRLEEIEESVSIIEQVASRIPGGPIRSHVEYRHLRYGLGATEAPRGENIHFVVTGYGGRLWRWKVRAPSYNNISILPVILTGVPLSDAPVVITSIDPCFSCTDRLVILDLKRRKRMVLKPSRVARGGGV